MSKFRCFLACATLALAGALPAAAQQNDYGGYDIGGLMEAEEYVYAQTRGWDVHAAQVGGAFAYCTGEKDRGDGWRIRLGWDGMQWQLAVPIDARPDWQGTLQIDGAGSGQGYRKGGDYISGTANGGWAIAWLGEAELDGMRQGSNAVVGVGRADFDFQLAGSAAAILKIQECVGRGGVIASTAQAPASPGYGQLSGSGAASFQAATSRPCSSVFTGHTSCDVTPWDPEPGYPDIVQVDMPGYTFLVKVADAGHADVWYARPGEDWIMVGQWAPDAPGSDCIEPLAVQSSPEARANLGQDYWQLFVRRPARERASVGAKAHFDKAPPGRGRPRPVSLRQSGSDT